MGRCDRWSAVVIRKIDLDTSVAAWLLGVEGDGRILVRPGGALPVELADPHVLCIEAGGSGDVSRSNFDHHEPDGPKSPAAIQAFRARGLRDPYLGRLAGYTAAVDLGICLRRWPGVSLSSLASGIRLVLPTEEARLRTILALLTTFVNERLDPFAPVSPRREWVPFVDARRRARAGLQADLWRLRRYRSVRYGVVGVLITPHIGALGAVYAEGCDIAVAFDRDPDLGPSKCTIGSRGISLHWLSGALQRLERGWGGPAHGTVLGSPTAGTSLGLDRVLSLAITGRTDATAAFSPCYSCRPLIRSAAQTVYRKGRS